MEALSRDFQEAAQLAARTVMLRPVMADLGVHLRHTLEAWRQDRPQVRWTLEAPDSRVELRFDPARMGQALDALLGHAERHGGEVRVELESTPSLVTVRVKDQGPGVSDEELRHLFEPFRAGGAGSGLGLFIASELARLHGGGLSVESRRGQGTTFSVVLPRG
jgi:signal transduction histidine kinase